MNQKRLVIASSHIEALLEVPPRKHQQKGIGVIVNDSFMGKSSREVEQELPGWLMDVGILGRNGHSPCHYVDTFVGHCLNIKMMVNFGGAVDDVIGYADGTPFRGVPVIGSF